MRIKVDVITPAHTLTTPFGDKKVPEDRKTVEIELDEHDIQQIRGMILPGTDDGLAS